MPKPPLGGSGGTPGPHLGPGVKVIMLGVKVIMEHLGCRFAFALGFWWDFGAFGGILHAPSSKPEVKNHIILLFWEMWRKCVNEALAAAAAQLSGFGEVRF